MATFVVACEPQEASDLPPVVAESKYIEYSTWADDNVVCMDDLLSDLDAYIEETAAFLEIDPPVGGIRYVWVPDVLQSTKNWPCNFSDLVLGCQMLQGGLNLVVSASPDHHHELVHAVSTGEFGRIHPVLNEGLATYLGNVLSTKELVDGFPSEFKALFTRGPDGATASLGMHYVGSVLDEHGVEKFKLLVKRMPYDADYETFSAIHMDIYSEDLAVALSAMTTPILSRLQATCDGEPLAWEGGQDLEVTVHGECGDGYLYGAGAVDGRPAFYKEYVLDIPVSGPYQLAVRSAEDAAAPALGLMYNCPGVESDIIGASNGMPVAGFLHQGPHRLLIGFPPGPEARGELLLSLRRQG